MLAKTTLAVEQVFAHHLPIGDVGDLAQNIEGVFQIIAARCH